MWCRQLVGFPLYTLWSIKKAKEHAVAEYLEHLYPDAPKGWVLAMDKKIRSLPPGLPQNKAIIFRDWLYKKMHPAEPKPPGRVSRCMTGCKTRVKGWGEAVKRHLLTDQGCCRRRFGKCSPKFCCYMRPPTPPKPAPVKYQPTAKELEQERGRLLRAASVQDKVKGRQPYEGEHPITLSKRYLAERNLEYDHVMRRYGAILLLYRPSRVHYLVQLCLFTVGLSESSKFCDQVNSACGAGGGLGAIAASIIIVVVWLASQAYNKAMRKEVGLFFMFGLFVLLLLLLVRVEGIVMGDDDMAAMAWFTFFALLLTLIFAVIWILLQVCVRVRGKAKPLGSGGDPPRLSGRRPVPTTPTTTPRSSRGPDVLPRHDAPINYPDVPGPVPRKPGVVPVPIPIPTPRTVTPTPRTPTPRPPTPRTPRSPIPTPRPPTPTLIQGEPDVLPPNDPHTDYPDVPVPPMPTPGISIPTGLAHTGSPTELPLHVTWDKAPADETVFLHMVEVSYRHSGSGSGEGAPEVVTIANPPSNAVEQYRAGQRGSHEVQVADLLPTSAAKHQVFRVRVRAFGRAGESGWSKPLLLAHLPSTPRGLDVAPKGVGGQHVDLQWDVPPVMDRVHGFVVEYDVTPAGEGASTTSHTHDLSWTATDGAPACTLGCAVDTSSGSGEGESKGVEAGQGLPMGGLVSNVRVRAVNADGTSDYCEALRDIRLRCRPSPPANLRVVDDGIGAAEVALAWDAPETRDVTFFKLEYQLPQLEAVDASGAEPVALDMFGDGGVAASADHVQDETWSVVTAQRPRRGTVAGMAPPNLPVCAQVLRGGVCMCATHDVN